MKTETKTLTFAALIAMTPAELFKLAGENAKVNDAVTKAKDKFTNALKPFAKIVAAMKRHYTELREGQKIPLDVPFKKFFKDNAKGELPGRAEALAALFNSLVLTLDVNGKPMLPEEYFDSAAVDWLEKANAIIKLAQKRDGENWKTCDDVLDTINALSKPGDAAKALREIRKRMKGETVSDDESDAVVKMTPALAAQYLVAALKTAHELPQEEQFKLCTLVYDVNDAWAGNGLTEETRNEFDAQITTARANGVADHVQIITSETEPAEPVAA